MLVDDLSYTYAEEKSGGSPNRLVSARTVEVKGRPNRTEFLRIAPKESTDPVVASCRDIFMSPNRRIPPPSSKSKKQKGNARQHEPDAIGA